MLWTSFESQLNHAAVEAQAFLENISLTDSFFVLTMVLLALTIALTLLYYRRMRQVSKAYAEAKDVVGDIIISVDKQLLKHEDQIGTAIHKMETHTAATERLSKRLDEQESRFSKGLADLTSKVAGFSDVQAVKTSLESLKDQLDDLVRVQEELKQHAATAPLSDSQVETAIPIKKERALAPLTETELRVLEFIATSPSGERTAPEVKDVIKLTREHTARLMKKLYEGGYLERRAERTPFSYRVKEEMLKILKKSEVG